MNSKQWRSGMRMMELCCRACILYASAGVFLLSQSQCEGKTFFVECYNCTARGWKECYGSSKRCAPGTNAYYCYTVYQAEGTEKEKGCITDQQLAYWLTEPIEGTRECKDTKYDTTICYCQTDIPGCPTERTTKQTTNANGRRRPQSHEQTSTNIFPLSTTTSSYSTSTSPPAPFELSYPDAYDNDVEIALIPKTQSEQAQDEDPRMSPSTSATKPGANVRLNKASSSVEVHPFSSTMKSTKSRDLIRVAASSGFRNVWSEIIWVFVTQIFAFVTFQFFEHLNEL